MRNMTKGQGEKPAKFIRRSGMNPLAARLPTVLRSHARRVGFVEADILHRWHHICPEFARYSYPAKLWQGRLTLAVNSDSAKQGLQYMKPALIEKINAFYGYEAVTALRLVTRHFTVPGEEEQPDTAVDAAAAAKAEKQCAQVKDTDLRAALQKLGGWIYSKKGQKE